MRKAVIIATALLTTCVPLTPVPAKDFTKLDVTKLHDVREYKVEQYHPTPRMKLWAISAIIAIIATAMCLKWEDR